MSFTSKLRAPILTLALILFAISCALAEPFAFIHISDAHITGSGHFVPNLQAVASEVNAMTPQPAFVIMTGDQTETGLTGDWEKYRETISAFKMPIYNVAGNHETKWSHWGKFALRKFLNQDSRYSFTHGGVHFVAMDSTVWLQHHGLIDQGELNWLKRDLDKAGRDTPSVLFYHHCPGFIPNELELLRTIRPYNVRLILVGHGHSFKTWKRNGVLFQEAKGVMNNEGGYRILEVSDTEIHSFTKLVGKDRKLDTTIFLSSTANPVTLISPRYDETINGDLHVRAVVTGGSTVPGRKIEYAIDGESKPITPTADGIYDVKVNYQGISGWHTVSVVATDADGMEWSDSAPVLIDPDSREAWRVRVAGGIERGVRAIGDKLYLGTLGGDVYCLDARTGRQVWSRNIGSEIVSEIAVQGDLACFGSTDGRVIALDARTGEPKWEYATGGPILASPAIGSGEVFIGSGEPAYYALDAASGKLRWRHAMDRATQVVPILRNGSVMFGAWDKNFYSLNARDGSIGWKTPIGISFYFSTANSDPITDGRRIVANVTPYKPEDSDIYCLDMQNGKVLWNRRNPGKSDCGFNSPCVDGDRFYSVSGNGDVFCMRMSDGKDIWRGSVGMTIVSGKPVVADGKLYIACLRGNVACLDAANGKTMWTYSTGNGYLFGGEAIWDDLLIVPSTDGTLIALKR